MSTCFKLILCCNHLILVLTFCNANKKESKGLESGNVSSKGDTIIKDISPILQRKIAKDFFPPDIYRLRLDDLREGFDQLQIRIWLNYALSDSAKVISITKKNEVWTSNIYYYRYTRNSDISNYEGVSVEKKYEQGTPTKGWNNFVNKLNDIPISTLKDYSQIDKYYLCNDGDGITLEIATKNKYQAFVYPCYQSYWNELDEAKKIKQLLLLIQNEIGFHVVSD